MATDSIHPQADRRNRHVAVVLFGVAIGMVGAAYAAVPLYDLFCRVTGYGGTTQVSTGNPKGVIAREMTTRFDANVNGALAWEVKAAHPVHAQIGTVETVVYVARNLTSQPLTGTASFNVTPERAGAYFNKIECFCFTEQTLQPGESVEMPVTFFVDPAIDDDAELKTIRDITLSYTFYASNNKGS